jgi:hypothetical protein
MVVGQAVAAGVGTDMEVVVVAIEEITVFAPGFEERGSIDGFVVDVMPCVLGETHGEGGLGWWLGTIFLDHW